MVSILSKCSQIFPLSLKYSQCSEIELFQVNDMQTTPPPFLKRSHTGISIKKKLRNVLKRMENQFSDICDISFLRYGRSKILE